MMEETVLMSWT